MTLTDDAPLTHSVPHVGTTVYQIVTFRPPMICKLRVTQVTIDADGIHVEAEAVTHKERFATTDNKVEMDLDDCIFQLALAKDKIRQWLNEDRDKMIQILQSIGEEIEQ